MNEQIVSAAHDRVVAMDAVRDVVEQLLELDGQYARLQVRVNSVGGEVYPGIAIFNALRQCKSEVTIYVDGIAASIAGVIALCGRRVEMSQYARLMLHSVSGGCYGNRNDLLQMAADIEKLEDMIASVKHGYMLFETDNGMEDPKNWAIQCVAQYGIEIVDGKLTENYVSPVVMSGYVPDLLKSISMISDDFTICGSGFCGKGYKEWVRVSDGGPALKVRVKLG